MISPVLVRITRPVRTCPGMSEAVGAPSPAGKSSSRQRSAMKTYGSPPMMKTCLNEWIGRASMRRRGRIAADMVVAPFR